MSCFIILFHIMFNLGGDVESTIKIRKVQAVDNLLTDLFQRGETPQMFGHSNTWQVLLRWEATDPVEELPFQTGCRSNHLLRMRLDV